jgi:transposase-like protein
MSDTKLKPKVTIPAEQSNKKHNELELVITPKNEVLKWFKSIKGIINEIEGIQRKSNLNSMECPNCKSQMLNYKSINEPGELWHVCSKCNISFTQRQHRYFTKMIKRLINEDSNTFLNNQYER